MLDKIKDLFGPNFLWGEEKNINIRHVFKHLKLKPIIIQTNSRFSHCFIMIIIHYFREFLNQEFGIQRIKEKYLYYFQINLETIIYFHYLFVILLEYFLLNFESAAHFHHSIAS